jgi:hypothetical protein
LLCYWRFILAVIVYGSVFYSFFSYSYSSFRVLGLTFRFLIYLKCIYYWCHYFMDNLVYMKYCIWEFRRCLVFNFCSLLLMFIIHYVLKLAILDN